MVVWRKLVHKQLRFGHFHTKFRPFLEGSLIMTKKYFRVCFLIFFCFNFTEWFLWNNRNILWWFGGNRIINGQNVVIFMPNYGPFWSVGIMTFWPSFFRFFHLDFTEWFLWTKNNILWWFEENWSINGQDLAIFIPILFFWSVSIMTKTAFRPSFFNFFLFSFWFHRMIIMN